MARFQKLALVGAALLATPAASAATNTLSSCAEADVNSALGAASDGDVIVCPAGSWSWANVDIVNRNVTLQGAGIGQTIVSITAAGGIEAPTSNTKAFRITGFTFASTANFGTDDGKAMMRIQGGHGWRVDHNRFEIHSDQVNYNGGNAVYTRNDVSGVVDHNEFVKGGGTGCMHASVYPEGAGATAWTWSTQLGAFDHTVFIEDNLFHNPNDCAPHNAHAVYGQNGGIFVFRHNEIHNMNADAHGFCAIHSTREWEISNNRWINDTGNSLWAMMHMRGGTGVIYGNSWTGSRVTYGVYWNEYRIQNSTSCSASATFQVPGSGQVAAASACPSTEGYPCAQQIGRGQNNGTDPAYLWNNTNLPPMAWETGVASYVVENRDYFLTGPKPGYTPYPYPHPLTQGGGTSGAGGSGGGGAPDGGGGAAGSSGGAAGGSSGGAAGGSSGGGAAAGSAGATGSFGGASGRSGSSGSSGNSGADPKSSGDDGGCGCRTVPQQGGAVGQSGRRPAAANVTVGHSGRRPAAANVNVGLLGLALLGILGACRRRRRIPEPSRREVPVQRETLNLVA